MPFVTHQIGRRRDKNSSHVMPSENIPPLVFLTPTSCMEAYCAVFLNFAHALTVPFGGTLHLPPTALPSPVPPLLLPSALPPL